MQPPAFPSTDESEGDSPEPVARVRRRRGELSRERVLAAALTLLEREGEGALSMRRVAAEIGTAPMSLYRHVKDKADLVDGVIGLALSGISTVPPEGRDWADRATAWMSAVRAEMHRHPAIVPLLRTNLVLLPAMLGPVEILLDDLREAGVPRAVAAKAVWEILWFTMGFVLSELRVLRSSESPAFVSFATAEGRADELPRLAEALPDLLALGGDDIFESGARHLVWGLRAELAGAAAEA